MKHWDQDAIKSFAAAVEVDTVNLTLHTTTYAPTVLAYRNKHGGFGVRVFVTTVSGDVDVTHKIARLLGLNMRKDGQHIDMGSDSSSYGYNPIAQLMGWLSRQLKTPRITWGGD